MLCPTFPATAIIASQSRKCYILSHILLVARDKNILFVITVCVPLKAITDIEMKMIVKLIITTSNGEEIFLLFYGTLIITLDSFQFLNRSSATAVYILTSDISLHLCTHIYASLT